MVGLELALSGVRVRTLDLQMEWIVREDARPQNCEFNYDRKKKKLEKGEKVIKRRVRKRKRGILEEEGVLGIRNGK